MLIDGQIISEIKASGLRGRGGAGFPSGLKWVGVQHSDTPIWGDTDCSSHS